MTHRQLCRATCHLSLRSLSVTGAARLQCPYVPARIMRWAEDWAMGSATTDDTDAHAEVTLGICAAKTAFKG